MHVSAFTGEKKKTKTINSELNPVWNEVSEDLRCVIHWEIHFFELVILMAFEMTRFLNLQVLEFDLNGSPLDASSFIDVVVKDYETIGKHK